MPTRRALTADQNNDMTYTGTATDADAGTPLDLTGVTLQMYIKPAADTDDDDPAVTVLSTETGDITITDPAAGAYSIAVPDTALTAAGVRWYRVDAITGGARKTIVYGPLKVRDL